MTDQELLHLNQAFGIVSEAIDAAMKGQFPSGINAVETHLQIKGSLQLIAKYMKERAEPEIKELQAKQAAEEASEQPEAPETKE